MKITAISVYRMTLRLEHPYSLSGGRLHFCELDTTFVCLQTDGGVDGWGEGCPWGSTYLPAFPGGLRAGIDELAPAVLGANPLRHDHINRIMDVALPGHPCVKSAIDTACYDIVGKTLGIPVADLLGGMIDEPITVQSSIPTGAPNQMVQSIEMARAKGYRVRRRTRQPILLDESMKGFGDVLRAVADGACEGIGLKLNRVGGLTKARRIRDLCVESGLRMNIEETGGTTLADTAAVHLAQSTPATHRKATRLCHEMLSTDPIVGRAQRQRRHQGPRCSRAWSPHRSFSPGRSGGGLPMIGTRSHP